MTDPSTDPVGTVRREEHEGGYSVWIRVDRSMVEGYGSNAVVFVRTEWRCVYSTASGNPGGTFTELPDFPAIGVVPGTPAAEPHDEAAMQMRLIENGRERIELLLQLATVQRESDTGKTCSCAPPLTSAGPRRLTAPECPEHGEGK